METLTAFLTLKQREVNNDTWSNYEIILNEFQEKTGVTDEKIIEEHIDTYINKLREDNKNSTVKKKVKLIKQYIRYLRDLKSKEFRRNRFLYSQDELIEAYIMLEEYNAIINKKHNLRTVKKDKLPFEEDELKKIFETARRSGHRPLRRRNYLIFRFLVGTGCRNTACRLLEVADLDCNACDRECQNCIPTVRIERKGRYKPGKISVQIDPEVCRELKQYIEYFFITSYVFQSQNGGPLSIPQMNEILRNVLEEAGIERHGRTIHSFRHTCITKWLKRKSLLPHVARQVDHEIQGSITFEEYTHLRAEELEINWIRV